MDQFDVVIVGARCAGSPLAAMLARRGFGVCVVDKAQFPSETPSTHVIQPRGVSVLDDIGALEPLLAAGAVPIDRFTLVNEDVRIDGRIEPDTFSRPGLCVRRSTMDALLVQAARDAGAEVRTQVKVTGLVVEDGRVAGVRTASGPIHAGLVVGADGRQSVVASEVRAREYHVVPGARTPAWAYFEGVAEREGRLRLGRIGEYAYLACPTDAGLYMAGITVDALPDGPIEDVFDDVIGRWPELGDLLAGARRVGPIRVMSRWHGYFRDAAGPGWALVGDSGHFKDFTPAQGIADALCQAASFAAILPADLTVHSGADADAALRGWWRARDRDAHPMYWFAADMGAPGPSTPLVTEVLRDVAGDPAATLTLLRVLNHDAHPNRVLTVGRLIRAAVRALRRYPGRRRDTLREIAASTREELRRAWLSRARRAGFTALRSDEPASSGIPAHHR